MESDELFRQMMQASIDEYNKRNRKKKKKQDPTVIPGFKPIFKKGKSNVKT